MLKNNKNLLALQHFIIGLGLSSKTKIYYYGKQGTYQNIIQIIVFQFDSIGFTHAIINMVILKFSLITILIFFLLLLRFCFPFIFLYHFYLLETSIFLDLIPTFSAIPHILFAGGRKHELGISMIEFS